jgi:hypothetical protein
VGWRGGNALRSNSRPGPRQFLFRASFLWFSSVTAVKYQDNSIIRTHPFKIHKILYTLDTDSVMKQPTIKIKVLTQAPCLATHAEDPTHNATRHSFPRITIYDLSIGRRDCMIYVTCKYMKACCCKQQMAGWLASGPFFSRGQRGEPGSYPRTPRGP